jgi:hypothetical protein
MGVKDWSTARNAYEFEIVIYLDILPRLETSFMSPT